jgi:succinate dehydrogenase flavin-adding protein (antitoxin of CptAB toxin-antitoxin module)
VSEVLDDMVEAWHTSGDEEERSLQQYLDMNDHEFRIWMMTAKVTQSYLDRHPEMI